MHVLSVINIQVIKFALAMPVITSPGHLGKMKCYTQTISDFDSMTNAKL